MVDDTFEDEPKAEVPQPIRTNKPSAYKPLWICIEGEFDIKHYGKVSFIMSVEGDNRSVAYYKDRQEYMDETARYLLQGTNITRVREVFDKVPGAYQRITHEDPPIGVDHLYAVHWYGEEGSHDTSFYHRDFHACAEHAIEALVENDYTHGPNYCIETWKDGKRIKVQHIH
jgi:hypothetical protein